MTATIESIQIGKVMTEGDPAGKDVTDFEWTSAFGKRAVRGPIELTSDRLVGDEFGTPKIHGGPEKAILCYAASHYRTWQEEMPELTWRGGAMGENLTIVHQDETTVCIGDVFCVGEAVVQISQPRQPCWKINRFHGRAELLKRVVATGRTGWYLRVLTPGRIEAGQTLRLQDRPQPDWTVARTLDALWGRGDDAETKTEMLAIPELSKSFGR